MVAGTASDPVSACGGFGRSQDQVLRPMAEKGQAGEDPCPRALAEQPFDEDSTGGNGALSGCSSQD